MPLQSEERFGISIFPDRHKRIMHTVFSLPLLYIVLKRTRLTVGKCGRRYKVNCKTKLLIVHHTDLFPFSCINPLKPELNPICYLLALLGAHHFLHVSRI